jgi:hypothetical protein
MGLINDLIKVMLSPEVKDMIYNKTKSAIQASVLGRDNFNSSYREMIKDKVLSSLKDFNWSKYIGSALPNFTDLFTKFFSPGESFLLKLQNRIIEVIDYRLL